MVTDPTSSWPDSPRIPGPPDPDPLPVGAIPPSVRAHVESVAGNLQVPPDLPLLLGLGSISAALSGKVEVEVRSGWREPVGIYAATILPPAARKSPAFAAMTEPIRRWEAETVERARPRVLAALDVVEVADRRLEATKRDAAKGKAEPAEVEAARMDLEKARAMVPPDGRLLAGDITPEAMVQRMAAQGGRLALLEPEPGPLQLLAGRYSDTARLDELKKAWSGETLLVDRVGRPPLRVRRPALTVVVCLQPGVLDALQNGAAFRVEGVIGRILWCEPPHGLGKRLTGRDVPPMDERARDAFSGLLGMLLDADAAGEEKDGTPRPHLLRLAPEAVEVLHAYEAEMEGDLGDRGRFAGIRDWAGKAVGQSVRVAALLELAARAGDRRPLFQDPIGPWAMESAVQILRALSTHALAVLGGMGMDKRTELLQYVFRRAQELASNPPPEEEGGANLRNLWQATRGRSAIESMDDLLPLVEALQDRGCLRLREQPSTGGRPPSPRIEIHPALRESIPKSPTSTPEEARVGTSGAFGDAFGGGADEMANPAEKFSEEDRRYLEDEREGMQVDDPPVEVPGLLEVKR